MPQLATVVEVRRFGVMKLRLALVGVLLSTTSVLTVSAAQAQQS
jgi:hypothetical protein